MQISRGARIGHGGGSDGQDRADGADDRPGQVYARGRADVRYERRLGCVPLLRVARRRDRAAADAAADAQPGRALAEESRRAQGVTRRCRSRRSKRRDTGRRNAPARWTGIRADEPRGGFGRIASSHRQRSRETAADRILWKIASGSDIERVYAGARDSAGGFRVGKQKSCVGQASARAASGVRRRRVRGRGQWAVRVRRGPDERMIREENEK